MNTLNMPIAAVDCETTGLDPAFHMAWEIAVIRRRADGQRETRGLWQIRPTSTELGNADPKALEVGRFHERFKVPAGVHAVDMISGDELGGVAFRERLALALGRAVLVGSNPQFDAGMFRRELLGETPWFYRMIDIVPLAAGHLLGQGKEVPQGWRSYDLSEAVGVKPPSKDDAHTAMGDAQWALDVFDAVTR